jgi:DNA-binding HxlR family transcriptional regulator
MGKWAKMTVMEERPGADGLQAAVARVGDRWSLLVIDALLRGPLRFGELQEALGGIATNVLSQRLRHLEHEGVVVAQPYSNRPPRYAYDLTAAGRDLAGALLLLTRWGSEQGTDDRGADAGPHHHACGTSLEPRWYCPTCDRAVHDDETHLDEVRWL